ncbi:MAG: PqqD family protein [Deltaproteobacteria bacterium]|nr:PqqD family protein [Deltaproteobacteria bacterium]
MTINNIDVYLPDSRTAYRKIGGKTVIVNTLCDALLRLNHTGTAIWERLDGRTVEEIARDVADLFDMPFDDVLEDVVEFLNTLSEKKLVKQI